MVVLLPFMNVLGVAKYLHSFLKEIPDLRKTWGSFGQDLPKVFIDKGWSIFNHFISLSQEAKGVLSERELSSSEGELAMCLYFAQVGVQEMFDILNDYRIPSCHAMRKISDGMIGGLEVKIEKLIQLLKIG